MQAVAVPESEWQATIAGFGFSPEAVNNYIEMMRGFDSGHIVFENNGTETRKGETKIKISPPKLQNSRILLKSSRSDSQWKMCFLTKAHRKFNGCEGENICFVTALSAKV